MSFCFYVLAPVLHHFGRGLLGLLLVIGSTFAATTSAVADPLTLVDADANAPIAAFDPLVDGAVIDLSLLPSDNLSVLANADDMRESVSGSVESVGFTLTGAENHQQTENHLPYALFGDSSDGFNAWTPSPGDYTLTVRGYTRSKLRGRLVSETTVSFRVVTDDGGAMLTLVDTDTDAPIAAFDPLVDGAVIDLSLLPSDNLSVLARVDDSVESVGFTLTGADNHQQTENHLPYALFGDSSDGFNAWTPSPGDYTLTVRGYTGSELGGDLVSETTVSFQITDGVGDTLDSEITKQSEEDSNSPNSPFPVIPGAVGFGIDTPAGRGGQIYRVTNLNDSGSGSLRECVEASGPRVCIFEVSGVIDLEGNLGIGNSNITIAGQTAPSPGIMLRGGTLVIKASDVLVQHIRVRPGDDPSGPDPENRDALAIAADKGTSIENIVVDHCTFNWSIDEMISLWRRWDNVTLRNNIFAEALNDSLHPKGNHGYGPLVGPSEGRVSFMNNLVAHHKARNPMSRGGELVFVNNVVYNWDRQAVDLQNDTFPSLNSFVGNVFLKGPDSSSNRVIELHGYISENAFRGDSRLYVATNKAPNSTDDAWSIVNNQSDFPRSQVEASSPPTWPQGLVAMKTADVLDFVLDNAGARPADRDAVETRITAQIRDRGGQIINCVAADGSSRCDKNAGGWPRFSENGRRLHVPADPHGDSDGDGYTNLEEWLHAMARDV